MPKEFPIPRTHELDEPLADLTAAIGYMRSDIDRRYGMAGETTEFRRESERQAAQILGGLLAMGLCIVEAEADPESFTSSACKNAFDEAREALGDQRGRRKLNAAHRAKKQARMEEIVKGARKKQRRDRLNAETADIA